MGNKIGYVASLPLALVMLSACGGTLIAPGSSPIDGQALPTPTHAAEAANPTPTNAQPTATPEEPFPGDGPWEVTFQTADGVTLEGVLYGKGSIGIVLAPGYPGEQAGWAAFAQAAAAQGYRALTFDLRSYGPSRGDHSLADTPADLAAALAFLREQGVVSIVLMGAGEGGIAAIRVASQESGVAGLVVISSPRAIEGLEATDADLQALRLPSLWIGARTDMEQAVEDMAKTAGGSDVEVWIYEGSSLHGTYLFEGADGPDLQRRLLEFVARVTGN